MQYFILTVPLMEQKYENGGFVGSIFLNKDYSLHALLNTCIFLESWHWRLIGQENSDAKAFSVDAGGKA